MSGGNARCCSTSCMPVQVVNNGFDSLWERNNAGVRLVVVGHGCAPLPTEAVEGPGATIGRRRIRVEDTHPCNAPTMHAANVFLAGWHAWPANTPYLHSTFCLVGQAGQSQFGCCVEPLLILASDLERARVGHVTLMILFRIALLSHLQTIAHNQNNARNAL